MVFKDKVYVVASVGSSKVIVLAKLLPNESPRNAKEVPPTAIFVKFACSISLPHNSLQRLKSFYNNRVCFSFQYR